MKRMVHLVGVGPGNPELLTPDALSAIRRSACLIGATRLLEPFADAPAERVVLTAPEAIVSHLDAHPEYAETAILLSGDVGFYSGAKRLRPLLTRYEITSHPGISSAVYLCARIGLSWDAVRLESAHGRDCPVLGTVLSFPDSVFLTGGTLTPMGLCRLLADAGLPSVTVTVGERLSYPDETLTTGTAAELCGREFDPLSVVAVHRGSIPARRTFPGIDDEEFIRGDAPMTKREVRSITLCHLAPEGIVYDVGAGTGSVAIEAALLAPCADVYAIEKNPAALALIKQNREKFGAYNLRVVAGEAPAALGALPAPDCVFIGGSSGNFSDILVAILQRNPSVRVVANAVTLETAIEALEWFERLGLQQVRSSQIAVTQVKKVGRCHMMAAQNPIFIISGQGCDR